MRSVEVQSGMSLMDVSLKYFGTVDMAMEIAEQNSLALDYTFDRVQTIDIPDYKDRVLMDMNTGIEGDNSWVWLLSTGKYNRYGRWVDYDWWKDK